jgi:small subunit ribosomal protein S6
MATLPTIYDLVLILSADAEDERRTQIRAEVEAAITGGGGHVEHQQSWGQRPLAYKIDHAANGDYYLLQFSAPPAVLETLTHNLHIADGVVRFRIIKVVPGTPPPPESAPPLVGAAIPAGAPDDDER